MRIGVLGTGTVGRTLAAGFTDAGHEVRVGSREAGEDKVEFGDAAAFGEVVVNATAGTASLEALRAAGAGNLAGKLLLDVANPLDSSRGMPPVLSVCNDDSLAEQIQREFGEARVVKSLNTVNAALMTDPSSLPDSHTIFVAGDDAQAKSQAIALLGDLGWLESDVMDLGDITAARGMEMYLALWLRLLGAVGSPKLNVKVVRA